VFDLRLSVTRKKTWSLCTEQAYSGCADDARRRKCDISNAVNCIYCLLLPCATLSFNTDCELVATLGGISILMSCLLHQNMTLHSIELTQMSDLRVGDLRCCAAFQISVIIFSIDLPFVNEASDFDSWKTICIRFTQTFVDYYCLLSFHYFRFSPSNMLPGI